MSSGPGKPVVVLLVLALLSGGAIALRSGDSPRPMTVWTFVDTHADSFRQVVREESLDVDVKLINLNAINIRLNALFDRGARVGESGMSVPDLVEIEIASVGRYFRAPVDLVGFLPLNDLLARSEMAGRIVESRLAPWSKDGVVFGIPHDVHPVVIAYRTDLWQEAGLDPADAATWAEFAELCRAYQRYWRSKGQSDRRALELPQAASDPLTSMLLQRGVQLVDHQGTTHLTDPRVIESICFYARCVGGPDPIGVAAPTGGSTWTREIADGRISAFIGADWRVAQLKLAAPELAGRIGLIPLPRFDPTDSPTSTTGGTMIGIPRQARDPQASWRLLESLYFSEPAMRARRQYTDVLPPLVDAQGDPMWRRTDPYFAPGRGTELFADLLDDVPTRVVTPFTALAQTALATVIYRATLAADQDDATLEQGVEGWLAETDADLRRRIEFVRWNRPSTGEEAGAP